MATHINDTYVSDRYIEDGDYWRISNLTVGYDFKYLWKKLPLNQARLYVTGQNIINSCQLWKKRKNEIKY